MCSLQNVSSIEILVFRVSIGDLPHAWLRLCERGNTILKQGLVVEADTNHIAHLPVPGSASARDGERGRGKEGEGEGGRVSEGEEGEEGGKERGREGQTDAYLPPLPYSPEGGVLTEQKRKRLWTRFGVGRGGCEEGEGKGEGCFVVPPAGTSLLFLFFSFRKSLFCC